MTKGANGWRWIVFNFLSLSFIWLLLFPAFSPVVIESHWSRNLIPLPAGGMREDPGHCLTAITDHWDSLMAQTDITHVHMRAHYTGHSEQQTCTQRSHFIKTSDASLSYCMETDAGGACSKGFYSQPPSRHPGIINLTWCSLSHLHRIVQQPQQTADTFMSLTEDKYLHTLHLISKLWFEYFLKVHLLLYETFELKVSVFLLAELFETCRAWSSFLLLLSVHSGNTMCLATSVVS